VGAVVVVLNFVPKNPLRIEAKSKTESEAVGQMKVVAVVPPRPEEVKDSPALNHSSADCAQAGPAALNTTTRSVRMPLRMRPFETQLQGI